MMLTLKYKSYYTLESLKHLLYHYVQFYFAIHLFYFAHIFLDFTKHVFPNIFDADSLLKKIKFEIRFYKNNFTK